jgi:hypothetical protein
VCASLLTCHALLNYTLYAGFAQALLRLCSGFAQALGFRLYLGFTARVYKITWLYLALLVFYYTRAPRRCDLIFLVSALQFLLYFAL